jgi:aminoglycoside 3-N-acetyltransferase
MNRDPEEIEVRNAWRDGLHTVGLRRGQTAVLAVDMGKLPLPRFTARLDRDSIRERNRRWCAFVLDCLLEQLGQDGTVIVHAFSYSAANLGSIYVHESTPSEVGPFTEYVRSLPNSRRSLHPMFSLAGVGRYAAEILDDAGKSGFGTASPFARLSRFDTCFLCLGADFTSVTYLHHLEHCYGCNHRFHKVLEGKVYRDGKLHPGPWLAYLRFRGTNAVPDLSGVEPRLKAAGVLREATMGIGKCQAADLPDVDRICTAMLIENPCAFARQSVVFRLEDDAIANELRSDPVLSFKLRFEP